MSWLWEIYNPATFYVVDPAPLSPFEEVDKAAHQGTCKINPLLRFADIFQPFYRENANMEENLRAIIENFLLHILARRDRLASMRYWVLQDEAYIRQLDEGLYGPEIKKRFQALSHAEKTAIAHLLRKQDNGSRLYFKEAMKAIFPGSRLYYYSNESRFVIWLPRQENQADHEKIALIEDLFLELDAHRPRYFWHGHFGIIDVPETMRIDQLVIY